jgi:hypothetical protein
MIISKPRLNRRVFLLTACIYSFILNLLYLRNQFYFSYTKNNTTIKQKKQAITDKNKSGVQQPLYKRGEIESLRVEKNKNRMALDQEVTLVNKYFEKIIDFGFEYVPKLIGGIIVLLDHGSQSQRH